MQDHVALIIFLFGVIHRVRAQNFRKTNISYPLIRTYVCYQEVKNVSFTENLACLLSDSKPFSKKSGILSTL